MPDRDGAAVLLNVHTVFCQSLISWPSLDEYNSAVDVPSVLGAPMRRGVYSTCESCECYCPG